MGLDVELEHGRHEPATDVTGDDPMITGKIALAHLKEFPDYYTRLARMEREADEGAPSRVAFDTGSFVSSLGRAAQDLEPHEKSMRLRRSWKRRKLEVAGLIRLGC
jgi:hypothetical protein